MSGEKKSTDGTDDPELSDLLDSALEDFDKVLKTKVVKDEVKAAKEPSQTVKEVVDEVVTDETWSQDFIKQAADQFEKNFQNLMQNGGESDLGSSLQKMAQSVASAIGTGPSGEADGDGVNFEAAIAQALKDLSATSENLQTQNATPGISEADLAAMFGQASLEEGTGDILPFMEGMMQSLLSKEVLYPSLKVLVDKYPAWLEEKKTSLPAEDLERYKKQLELMQKVCTEIEKEKDDDTEDVKKRRFAMILSLMEEMQSYGQPPEELVGEQHPSLFQFDPEGNPIMPTLPPGAEPPQNCSVM